MKMRIIAVVSFAFICIGLHGEHSVYDATTKVVWDGVVDDNRQAVTRFSDGSEVVFVYWKFDNPIEMYLDDVVNKWQTRYGEIQNKMLAGGKISAHQAKSNMAWWLDSVQESIVKGYYNQVDLCRDWEEYFEQMYGSDSEEVQDMIVRLENYILKYESDAMAAYAGIEQKFYDEIADLQGELNTAKTLHEQATTNLQNTDGKTTEQVNAMKATQEKTGLKVAEIQKTINDLKNKKNSANIITPRLEVQYGQYSNDMKRISLWLGTNAGKYGRRIGFQRPVNPLNNEVYSNANENITHYLFRDYGAIPYVKASNMTNWVPKATYPSGTSMFFDQEGDGGETNVVSTFKAPKNWVDGTTITCSNGVYKANAGGLTDFHGTDGSHAVATNHVYFGAMEDSDVRVNVSTNANGVLIKFGVYWK